MNNVFMIVVMVVGAVLIITVLGITYLAVLDKTTPDVLSDIAVNSLIGLLGLLVPREQNNA